MTEIETNRRILITGAAGGIGSALRDGLKGQYELLRLIDIQAMEAAGPGEDVSNVDILDLDALTAAMADIDCVVHMAAVPVEGDWESILSLNIIGCYNVFEAARRAGVKRVVYASSNHTIGFHRRSVPLDTDIPPRPDSRYGVSKVYGEALARLYADKHGLSVSCLRIGSFRERPMDVRQLMTWISPRDTVHLVRRCIDFPQYHFAIIYGVSNNDRNIWDNSKVAWLGYSPQDNAEDYASELLASGNKEDEIAQLFHGGEFCSAEFSGDVTQID